MMLLDVVIRLCEVCRQALVGESCEANDKK